MFYSKELKKYKKIKHCFFSRNNGFSRGVYKSLNCGKGSKDNSKDVIKNLKFVSRQMNSNFNNLILMNQSHSNKVIIIGRKNLNKKKFNSDALVTDVKNITIGVLTADCVPIILFDEINDMVGCVHAGWKGAISGIIENTVNVFKKKNKKNSIIASIGPCIGKKNYEVKINFYKKFIKESKSNNKFFSKIKKDRFFFDIRGYVANKLRLCGVSKIDNINYDTFKESDKFYSYRRSIKLQESDYGRCISTISLKN